MKVDNQNKIERKKGRFKIKNCNNFKLIKQDG